MDTELCAHIKFFEQRASLLAEQLHDASVENFRGLHKDLDQTLGPAAEAEFAFDDSANLLLAPGQGATLSGALKTPRQAAKHSSCRGVLIA